MNKSCLLAFLISSLFFSSSAFSLVFSFLPFQLTHRGIDSLHAGFIIAYVKPLILRFAGISYFLVTYFLSPCLYVRCGLSRSLSLGLMIHSASLILLAIAYFSNKQASLISSSFFLLLTYVSRLFQGAGQALTSQVVETTAKIVFYQSEQRISLALKIFHSLAVVLGPLIGNLLFRFFGYPGVFFGFGGMEILFLLVKSFLSLKPLILKYQRRVKRDQQITEWETFSTQSQRELIPLSSLCKSLVIPFSFQTQNLLLSIEVLGLTALYFLAPLLPYSLLVFLHSSPQQVTYFFALCLCSSLVISLILVFLPWQTAAPFLVSFACLSASLGAFLLASPGIIGLSPTIAVSVSLVLLGSAHSFLLTLSPFLAFSRLNPYYENRSAEIQVLFGRLQYYLKAACLCLVPVASSLLWRLTQSLEVVCWIYSGIFIAFSGFHLFSALRKKNKESELKSRLLT